MKQMLKRIGSLVMALFLVLGLLPVLPHAHVHAATIADGLDAYTTYTDENGYVYGLRFRRANPSQNIYDGEHLEVPKSSDTTSKKIYLAAFVLDDTGENTKNTDAWVALYRGQYTKQDDFSDKELMFSYAVKDKSSGGTEYNGNQVQINNKNLLLTVDNYTVVLFKDAAGKEPVQLLTFDITWPEDKTEITELTPATCTTAGVAKHVYKDAKGTGNDWVYNNVPIPALGHDVDWAEVANTDTHAGTCARENCGQLVTEDCTFDSNHVCTVCGGDEELYTDKTTYEYGEPILVTVNQYGDDWDWIGIYKKGETYDPDNGGVRSIFWYYVYDPGMSTTGVNILATRDENHRSSEFVAGEYTVVFFPYGYYTPGATYDITVTTEIDESKTVTVPATCENPGSVTYYNTDGTVAKVDPINALEHDYETLRPTFDEENLQHTLICNNDNNHTVTENCKWDEGTVIEQPTPEQEGTKEFVCTVCGGKRYEKVSNKVIDREEVTKKPTCDEPGVKTVYYTDETSEEVPIPKLNHAYPTAWTYNNDKTTHIKVCGNDSEHVLSENCSFESSAVAGGTRYTCSVCGGYYDVIIMSTNKTEYALGEPILITVDPSVYDETATDWVAIWENDLTWTDKVSIYYYYPQTQGWSDFNVYESEFHQRDHIAQGTYTIRLFAANDYNEITNLTITVGPAVRDESKTVRVEPTCTTDGSITYYLTDGTLEKVVTAAEDETLKAFDHAYPDTWTHVTGTETHSRVCANNAEHVETQNCDWDDGVETVPPTADTKGEMKYTCTVCGGTKLEEIPVLTATEVGREVIDPTCTDQGYTLITYSDGSTRKVDYQAALDHNFGGEYTHIVGTHTHSQKCQRNDCDEVEINDCVLETDGVSNGDGYQYACTKCGEWTEPIIITDKTVYASGEDIIVTIHPTYAATMSDKDWIGLYHKGEVPNREVNPSSIRWDYAVEFKNGKSIFTTFWHDRPEEDPNNFLKAGEYILYLCANDGYEVITKVSITVVTQEDPSKTVQVDPTCTVPGTITYYNTDGTVSRVVTEAEDENLKAHGHTFGTWTFDGIEKQTHTHVCVCTTCAEPCNGSETESCEWDNGVETKPATETETGIKTYTCIHCSGTKEEVLPKLNVTVVGTDTVDPTCDNPGYIRTYYSDDTYSDEVLPKKGHAYGEWIYNAETRQHSKTCANDATHVITEDCDMSKTVVDTSVNYTCSVCHGGYVTGLLETDKTVYGVKDPIMVTVHNTFPGAWVGLYREGEMFDPDNGGIASLFWAYTDGRVGQPFDLTAVEATTTTGHRGEKLGNGKYVLVLFGDSGYTNVIETLDIEIFTDMSNVEFKLEFLGKNERENGAHIQVNANKFDYVGNSGNQVTTYVTPLKKGTTEAADPMTAWIGIYEGSMNLESEFNGVVPMGTFNIAEHNGTKITLNLPKYGMNFKPGYIYTLVVFADAGTSQPVKYITFESIRDILSETVYKEATCDTPGSKYVVYVDDGKDHTEDAALIIIPALGHDLSNLACIEGTNTHGRFCQREDCDYEETEDCAFVDGVCTVCEGIEYHIHALTKIPAVPVDCENDGNIEYYTCQCDEWFLDAEATQKIEDKNSVKIVSDGHAYGQWQYNEQTKKHSKTCANDATHVITEDCQFDACTLTKQPTATSEGEETYYCSICDGTYTNAIPMISYDGGERVFGSDRYHTSVQIADSLKEALGIEKFDAIVVASGLEFADSLSGTYLANKKNAPILLIRNRADELALVKEYIQENLNPGGTVYLLGGTSAVSKAMETGMEGYTVKRLGGANRYETNLQILKEAGVTPGEDILICTGKNFADGLSASALNKPVLLVKDTLTKDQTDFLASVSGGKIYIIGGNVAVNERIAAVLGLYGTTERISGETRYETSVNIAKKFFGNTNNVVLASGEDFPDGLCGGTLASAMNAPIILVANSANKYTMAEEYVDNNGICGGVALGGSGRINSGVMEKIFK